MKIARKTGLDVADVEFHQVGQREVVLVRRFDRSIDSDGLVSRNLFASAHTVLHLDHHAQGSRSRSYIALANALQRFCADRSVEAKPLQQELWRRMVFNVICGNGDDHPRNHGFIHLQGHWRLAPAFDIAPYITYSGIQSMALTRSGSFVATRGNLLADCKSFHWNKEEAVEFIAKARMTLLDRWAEEVTACGFDSHDLPVRDPEVWLNKA
jgi:serine/threonine-protein kinase HipA